MVFQLGPKIALIELELQLRKPILRIYSKVLPICNLHLVNTPLLHYLLDPPVNSVHQIVPGLTRLSREVAKFFDQVRIDVLPVPNPSPNLNPLKPFQSSRRRLQIGKDVFKTLLLEFSLILLKVLVLRHQALNLSPTVPIIRD